MKIEKYLFLVIVLVSFAAATTGCKNAQTNSAGASLVSCGSVAGRVTDGSQGIADIAVHVCNYENDNFDTLECIDAGSATTDANGYYTVNNIHGGDYYVYFDAGTTGYASLWYGNMRSVWNSDKVLVTPPNTVTADAELVPGGGISGTITDGISGVGGVWVDVADVNTGFIGAVQTSATGSYALNGLTMGEYIVWVDGCSEGYMSTSYSAADKIAVSAGQYVSDKNIVISPGATISGTITNGTSGIEGVYVLARSLDGSSDQFTYTSSSGDYSLRGLSPDSYQICFSAFDLGYLPQCYNGAEWSYFGNGEIFSVTGQQVISNIDVVMSPAGSISGRVTDGSTGLSGILVEVYDINGSIIDLTGSVKTSYPTGSYYFGGLSSGTYHVCFNAGNSGYVSQCYRNKSWNEYGSTSDPVLVTSPQTTASIDAVLVKGGAISGAVTDGSTGISDISVYVYDTMGNWVRSSHSNAQGDYTLRGLPSGTYQVEFIDYTDKYANQYYPSTVQVTAPGTTTGINAVLSLAGAISGTVTDGTTGLSGISVFVYDSFWKYVSSGNTDASGVYTVRGLPSGSYHVGFYDFIGGYIDQLYPSSVQVTAPGTTTGINAVLSLGGSISGTVTSGTTGAGIIGVSVNVYDANSVWYGSAMTNSSGQYIVQGLPSGTYNINFSLTGYSDRSVNGVDVTAPAETTSINAVF